MRKIISNFLATTLFLSSAMSGVCVFSLKNSFAEPYVPKDTVSLTVLSDGTHSESSSKTFINAQNGYKIGDNSPTDGIVASGDIVTYKLTLDIVTGPARTLTLDFANSNNALDINSLNNIKIVNSAVSTKVVNGKTVVNVTRGVSGKFEVILPIRANDTKGTLNKNNIVTAILKNGNYTYTTKARPIDVISAPFADLKLTSISAYDQVGTNKKPTTTFKIVPYKLGFDNYSSAGFSDNSTWHTDINVSEFPAGTEFRLDGRLVNVEDGKLKDIKGSGVRILTVKPPNDTIPNRDNPEDKNYKLWLEPYDDSFNTADFENVKDIGKDKPSNYDTSTFTINGNKVKAHRGEGSCKNNNYVNVTYAFEPPTDIIDHFLMKHVSGRIIFEDKYRKFNTNENYINQSVVRTDVSWSEGAKYITNDHDMVSVVTMKKDYIENQTTDKVVTNMSINYKPNATDYVDVDFDVTKEVQVVLGEKLIPKDCYEVEWRYNDDPKDFTDNQTKWLKSKQAPNRKVNQMRVSFIKDAFTFSDDETQIKIYTPLVSKSDYNPDTDMGKKIDVSASVMVLQKPYTGSIPTLKGTLIKDPYLSDKSAELLFPRPPSVVSRLYRNIDSPEPVMLNGNNSSSFRTEFRTDDIVSNLPTEQGYTLTRKFVLDDMYRPDTFKILGDSPFKIKSINGQEVEVEAKDIDLIYGNYNMKFEVLTKENLKKENNDAIQGSIKEYTTLHYPKVYNLNEGEVKSQSTTTYTFPYDASSITFILADKEKEEIENNIGFTVISKSTEAFSQEVILPKNNDSSNWNEINQANGTNISDDGNGNDPSNTYDGKTSSKLSGTYTIDKIKLASYANDTIVIVKDSTGKTHNLPIADDGTVDTSSIKDLEFGTTDGSITFRSQQKISNYQGIGFKANIELKPKVNNKNDVYIMWLKKTRDYNETHNLSERLSWPDDVLIVDSTISGYVFKDDNKDGIKDDEESAYENVLVSLYIDKDGKWEPIKTPVKTDKDGRYEFKKLHSGRYKTELTNIIRTENDTTFTIKNDLTSDGTLTTKTTNRFGVEEPTEQTYSYQTGYGKYAKNYATFELGKEETKENISYGFMTHNKDMALDKTPAIVTQNDKKSIVEWNVVVKNTSKEPIENVKVFDRTSKDVNNVVASLGTTTYKPAPGTRLYPLNDIPNLDPPNLSVNHVADGIVTNKGLFYFNMNKMTDAWVKSTNVVKLDDIPNEIEGYFTCANMLGKFDSFMSIGIIAKDRLYIYKHVYEIKAYQKAQEFNIKYKGASIDVNDIITANYSHGTYMLSTKSNGVLYVKADTPSTYEDGLKKLTLSEPNDIIQYIFANRLKQGDIQTDILIAKSGNVYKIKKNSSNDPEATLIGKIQGTVKNISNLNRIIVTTKGVYEVSSDETQINKIYSGDVKTSCITEDSFGYVITKNNELVKLTSSSSNKLTSNWSSSLVKMVQPLDAKTNGIFSVNREYIITFSDKGIRKFRVIDKTVDNYKAEATQTAANLDIPCNDVRSIVDMTYANNVVVLADNKLMSIDYYSLNLLDQTRNIETDPSRPPEIFTDKWTSNQGGTALRSKDYNMAYVFNNSNHVRSKYLLIPEFKQVESFKYSSIKEEGNFINREYEIPRLEPDQTVTINIKGEVINTNQDKVVGNQAYATSEKTPRSGITTSTVTGANMPSGVPDLPILPSPNDIDFSGIKNSQTVGVNLDLKTDDRPKDDLADQTPALIKAIPDPIPLNAKISGTAWYDINHDGIRQDDEPKIARLTVQIRNKDNNTIFKKETSQDGSWSFTDIPSGQYEVSYDISNHIYDNKIWLPTINNNSNEAKNSDADSMGIIDTVDANTTDKADIGLFNFTDSNLNNKIRVTKGKIHKAPDGSDDNITIQGENALENTKNPLTYELPNTNGDPTTIDLKDNDNDETTQGYYIKVENTSGKNITNVNLVDTTLNGTPAKMSPKLIYATQNNKREVTFDDNFTVIDPNTQRPLIMEPNSTLYTTFGIAFDKTNNMYESTITANASLIHENKGIIDIKDTDGFKASYKQVNPRRQLIIKKLGVTHINDDKPKALANTLFKVYKDKNANSPIGEYYTDENGQVTISRLRPGTYTIKELEATPGYVLAKNVWRVTVNKNNELDNTELPTISVSADPNQPYATVHTSSNQQIWGSVDLYNYKSTDIPITGVMTTWIILTMGATTTAIGFILIRHRI